MNCMEMVSCNVEFKRFLEAEGTGHKVTVPHSSRQNRRSERLNCALQEMTELC